MTEEEKKELSETVASNEDRVDTFQTALKQKDTQIEELNRKHEEEVRKLTEMIVNGQTPETPNIEVVRPNGEIIEELFNHENSNLKTVELALELRKNLMAEGKEDPFLPVGKNITPTDEDRRSAEKVAEIFQECVDYAQGDSQVFTNELMRRTNDVRIRR